MSSRSPLLKRLLLMSLPLFGIVLCVVWWWPRTPSPASEPDIAIAKVIERLPAKRFTASPSEEPVTNVECELAQKGSPSEPIVVEEFDFSTLEPLPPVRASLVDRRWLSFRPQRAVGVGRVYRDNREIAAIGWFDGACIDIIDTPMLPVTSVEFFVEGAEHFQDATVLLLDEKGKLSRSARLTDGVGVADVPVDYGTYLAIARVRYGTDTYTTEKRFLPRDTPRVEMVLDIPTEPHDWRLEDRGDHVWVDHLWIDGEAAAAGVKPGDIFVEADGVPAESLSIEQLQTATQVVLDRDGERVEVVFEPL